MVVRIVQNRFSDFLCKHIVKHDAITIYPFIFFAKDLLTVGLLAHELCHIKQYKERGWFGFMWAYLIFYIKYGYFKSPLEVEARKDWGKYVKSAQELIRYYKK